MEVRAVVTLLVRLGVEDLVEEDPEAGGVFEAETTELLVAIGLEEIELAALEDGLVVGGRDGEGRPVGFFTG